MAKSQKKNKFPQPYFRAQRGTRCVQLGGKQITLGEDRDEALREYHRLMAERGQDVSSESASTPGTAATHTHVVTILDSYLDWLLKRVEEGTKGRRTYRWYHRYLQDFVKFSTLRFSVADLTVDQFQPFHVYEWVDSHPEWKTGKRGAMISVQRPFAWAAKAGLLKSIGGTSPLAGLEKPAQGRREQLVSEEEYRDILAVLTCPEAKDLVELAWETGMRPAELYSFEARFFEPEAGRLVFPVRLSKGKKFQRVVYLDDKALEIVRRRVQRFPEGPVLRNADGRAWNMSSTNNLFQRVRVNLGRGRLQQLGLVPPKVPRLKAHERAEQGLRAGHERRVLERRSRINRLAWEHGTKYSIYAMRHAFCTEALENGLDAVTVSVLMGHRDTTMISRVYSHVDQRHQHMRQAANRARRQGA